MGKIIINFNYKENKENIEINDNIKKDKYKRIKSPENKKRIIQLLNMRNFGKSFKKRYYKINTKKDLNDLNILNKNFIK